MSFRKQNQAFGKVRSVDGGNIVTKAEILQTTNPELNVEVGAFVNCGGFHGDTICSISRVTIEENKANEEIKLVELSIIGSIDMEGNFSRGVEQLPTISCDVFLLDGEQVNKIMGVNSDDGKFFKVGKRSMRGAGDVYIDLDKLLGRHTAILGTTGSGKSSTVSTLVQSILRDYPFPRIMIFDIHNEYSHAFKGEWEGKSNSIKWSEFSLPYWFFDLDEFIATYYPGAGSTQKMILKNLIEELKKERVSEDKQDKISVDSPVFFDINDLIRQIKEKETLESTQTKKDPWNKLLLKLNSVNDDSRYDFLKKDIESELSLSSYFNNLLGLNNSDPSYITILDLSGLPAEVRSVCVGILSRLCFDFRYWDMDPANLPLALVLEEAHSYIPEESSSDYSLCLQRIEKVAKEGRKYGLSLLVVTQRPSNVSPTVLSQCGTFIVLRLTSDLDQNKVKRILPDIIGNQSNILPSLRDREALVTGDAVLLPGKVLFDEPSPWPKSNDIKFHKSWSEGPPAGYDVVKIVEDWTQRQKG
ncbi:ATP-binding protein [Alkalihalobacterium elongatum]|uniref:ATP-binding protein n=1 Tax=Alkalihalobacterium elongatum TaxID=2675466 RepID=UPI001C1FB304|nr:ATP-binding protein [Alkalihalobacterium elongatum]